MKKRDVAVLILYKGDEMLLQKRSLTAKRFPGKWGLFGGGIEDGETPETAVRREIEEELGLILGDVEHIYDLKYFLQETNEMGTIFTFTSNYNNEKLSLNEGDEMRWVNIDDLQNFDISTDYKKIIYHISQKQNHMVI